MYQNNGCPIISTKKPTAAVNKTTNNQQTTVSAKACGKVLSVDTSWPGNRQEIQCACKN